MAGGVRVPVTGSGRTDRGVTPPGRWPRWTSPPLDLAALRRSLNALLPSSIWVEEVRRVPPAFHPRFDARRRSYGYQVGTAPVARSPFLRRICWPQGATRPPPETSSGPPPPSFRGTVPSEGLRPGRAGGAGGPVPGLRRPRWTPGRREEGESLGWPST
jgi:hypothetical protein